MPTSSLRTLLAQFQSRYPMGCLSSDLLTIHQGQYVVRSVAQIGGTVLATGMASASEIEAAEDRSKLRALEALGLGFVAGAGSSSTIAFPGTLNSPPLPNPEPLPAENAAPTSSLSAKERFSSLPPLEPELETFEEVVSPSVSLPKAAVKPIMPKAPSPLTPASAEFAQPDATTLTGSGTADLAEDEPTEAEMTASEIPDSIPLSNSLPNRSSQGRSTQSLDEEIERIPTDLPLPGSSPFSAEPSRSVDSPFASGATTSGATASGATALSSPSATKPEKAGKTSKRKSEAFELPPAPIPTRQPSDRSEEIMRIGIEMKRLGWSTEQGREYLKRTYGKRSRQELDDAELLDFLRYLETQPASMQTPF